MRMLLDMLFLSLSIPVFGSSIFCNSSRGYSPIWENPYSSTTEDTIHLQNIWINQTFSNTNSYNYVRQIHLFGSLCSTVNKTIIVTIEDITVKKDIFYSVVPVQTSSANQSYISLDLLYYNVNIVPNHKYSVSLYAKDAMCVNISQQPVQTYTNTIGVETEALYIQNKISANQLIGSICIQPVPTQCKCRHSGVNCIANCSYNFCLCSDYGIGYMMNTSAGTACLNDIQVWANDAQCLPPSFSQTNLPIVTPSSTPTSQPTYQIANLVRSCTCSSRGISCTHDCDTSFCLCGESKQGSILNTSQGTVCYAGQQVWLSDPVCQNSPVTDGLYCTSECSLTYYYYSNGIRYPEQFTPSGTVCSSNGTIGTLIHPYDCLQNNTVSVPSHEIGWTCNPNASVGLCSTELYYAVDGNMYANQHAPSGLLCYNNSLVLSSIDACVESLPFHTPISFSLLVDPLIDSSYGTLLGQTDFTASIAESLQSVGAPIQQNMVVLKTMGRRLLGNYITLSIYTPNEYVNMLPSSFQTITKVENGRSILSSSLSYRNRYWEVQYISSSGETSTPFYKQNIIIIPVAICVGFLLTGFLVFVSLRYQYSNNAKKVKNRNDATILDEE